MCIVGGRNNGSSAFVSSYLYTHRCMRERRSIFREEGKKRTGGLGRPETIRKRSIRNSGGVSTWIRSRIESESDRFSSTLIKLFLQRKRIPSRPPPPPSKIYFENQLIFAGFVLPVLRSSVPSINKNAARGDYDSPVCLPPSSLTLSSSRQNCTPTQFRK